MALSLFLGLIALSPLASAFHPKSARNINSQLPLRSANTENPVQYHPPQICPEVGESSVTLLLDPSQLHRIFYLGEFHVTRAGNATHCAQLAQESQCEGASAEFYVFANNLGPPSTVGYTEHDNCAFGSTCVGLPLGDLEATVGHVVPSQSRCPKAAQLADADLEMDLGVAASAGEDHAAEGLNLATMLKDIKEAFGL